MNCGKKNSRYANFNELSTPSYAIFDFVKTIPDMLILVLYLPQATPLWIMYVCQKKSRHANLSAVFTPSYAIVNCVKNIDMLMLVFTWHTL